jgi:hypothetical protein
VQADQTGNQAHRFYQERRQAGTHTTHTPVAVHDGGAACSEKHHIKAKRVQPCRQHAPQSQAAASGSKRCEACYNRFLRMPLAQCTTVLVANKDRTQRLERHCSCP